MSNLVTISYTAICGHEDTQLIDLDITNPIILTQRRCMSCNERAFEDNAHTSNSLGFSLDEQS
jgi:hypothetical protein